MVHHTPKYSDEYKVIINLNLPHLESLITCATDFISSLKKEFLSTTQIFHKAGLPTERNMFSKHAYICFCIHLCMKLFIQP